jgi:hypothetical protein
VKVTLCMQNVKRLMPILILVILFFVPFNTAFAYPGGLVNGSSFTIAGTHVGSGTSTLNLTDNNESTSSTLGINGSTNDTAYTVLPTVKSIASYQLKSSASLRVYFYDVSGTQIGLPVDLIGDGVKRDLASGFENVKKVALINSASGVSGTQTVSEFDVFEGTVIPIIKKDVTNVAVNTVKMNTANITWSIPTGYSGVTLTGYLIQTNGSVVADLPSNETSYSISGLTVDTSYTYYVLAKYSDGTNMSAKAGNSVTFKTDPIPPDTTPPSKPSGLIADYDGSKVNLTFDENTESDLDHYNIYRNDVKLVSVSTNSYIDSSVTDGKTYTYKITAVDTAGNESSKSEPVSISIAEKFEVNFVPNADAILVQVSGGKAPFTVEWGSGITKTFSGTSYTITGLTLNTDYVVKVTDDVGAIATKSVNTGSVKKYLPPNLPSIVELFQKMLDSFGTAGTIALAIIGGAIALGIITVLGMFGWRTFKKWLASAK